ncbi:ogr/Delta-like zinc finger family protein [Marinomonas mediterranea]|uniref:ogr/Delta-like zinc finger family protein n=1 Tax=Marinomonas mediterranea TaxID=119864 RepID=UPI0011D29573
MSEKIHNWSRHRFSIFDGEVYIFRINCPHCNSKCVIAHSNDVSGGIDGLFVKDLYCHCHNPDCCASFVVRAAHTHYLQPPRNSVLDMAKALVKKHEEQLELGGI